jgi:hypothetical protein
MIAAQAKCLILTQFILRIPDHQYNFVAYSNGVAKYYGSPKPKQEWANLSGNIDLLFLCDQNGKNLVELTKNIKIYPNPVLNEFNIDGITDPNCSLGIYDLHGSLVANYYLKTGQQKINLANMSKGLYLVKVKDPKGNNLKTIKLVVE